MAVGKNKDGSSMRGEAGKKSPGLEALAVLAAESGEDRANIYGEVDVVNIGDSQVAGMEHVVKQPESLQQSQANDPKRHSTQTLSLTREQLVQTIIEGLPTHVSSRDGATLNATCQVEGCEQRLCFLKDYHQRYRVCAEHLKCDSIIRNGVKMRFCQQCGKFEDLELFDKGKRSCRERLRRHNERRRKRVDKRYATALMMQMAEGSHGDVAAAELFRRAAKSSQRGGERPPASNPGHFQQGFGMNFHPMQYGAQFNGTQHGAHFLPPQYGASHPALQYTPSMPTPSMAPSSHSASPIGNGMDTVSDLLSYMIALRGLSTVTTDLETDTKSQTCAGLVNMALNVNIMPKIVPSPRTMELLLRNFAGAFRYDLASISLRPSLVSIGGCFRDTPDADVKTEMGGEMSDGPTKAEDSGGVNGSEGRRVKRRVKLPAKLRDFEGPDWVEGTEGLSDLMNFASEAGSG